ncbi:tectonic-1 isoform X1 [Salmo salar]|uniref:Tectonic-1 isoform X1 n=1 Tax=Salmo salar TaxID=8030 RepID=A0A1S3P5G5_SALSA|nr:tectonic-1 isoform X1 [Salmo salar]|eukprot:XP_014022840.1 PREDICTED: tectonic-1 isoform X1 [Salmo salar]
MDVFVWVLITLYTWPFFEFSVAQKTDDFNSTFARANESVIDLLGKQNFTDYENSNALDVEIVSTASNVVSTRDGTGFSTPSTTESTPPSMSPQVPLPLSGSLPPPVTDVSRICPCDQLKDQCDPNCCCDPDCRQELALFTGCTVKTVRGEPKLCGQDVVTYTISETIDGYAQVQKSVQQEVNLDVFCIQSTNYEAGLSLATPEVPSAGNFDGLYKHFVQFLFGSANNGATTSTVEPLTSPGYLYGDVIETEEESGGREFFRLPAPSVTAHCSDLNPAAFLREQSNRCMRSLVLERDCTTLQALNMHSYTDPRILSKKSEDARFVAVEVTSIVLQSLEGTQTQLNITGDLSLDPLLLVSVAPDSVVCFNVVLQVGYTVTYSEAGDIVNVTASLVLGEIDRNMVPMEQEFQIEFVQQNVDQVALPSSGNPGYVVGLPLLAGSKTADGIVHSADSRGAFTLLHGSKLSDCLRGPHHRSPVLFGVDMVSGCTLRLDETANCSVVSEVVLGVLRGQSFPRYVASFGNSPPQHPMDWVPIRNQTKPTEAQSCSIPLSLHLEVQWTQYGSLVNPQAQIVSVIEVIHTNTSNLALLSGGSRVMSVTSSVTFVPVSAAARPGFKASPTIDAKLPYDFFFPFV